MWVTPSLELFVDIFCLFHKLLQDLVITTTTWGDVGVSKKIKVVAFLIRCQERSLTQSWYYQLNKFRDDMA